MWSSGSSDKTRANWTTPFKKRHNKTLRILSMREVKLKYAECNHKNRSITSGKEHNLALLSLSTE